MAKAGDKTKNNQSLVYVIAGDEPSLVNAKYAEIIDGLVPAEERDTGLLVVDADKAVIGEILDELRTLPFFTKRKIVALRNADKLSPPTAMRMKRYKEGQSDKPCRSTEPGTSGKYFDNPCPTGILVMTVTNGLKIHD